MMLRAVDGVKTKGLRQLPLFNGLPQALLWRPARLAIVVQGQEQRMGEGH